MNKKTVIWNTGSAAARFRSQNKKNKKRNQGSSSQAGGPSHKDPFGFNKAINWEKLDDPETLKELEKILDRNGF
tara:strand:+ start:155 stop:376 length:222 start_codon:yes stop_codon:yes gene_type:complete